jgi:hypothetical protein
VGARVDQAAAEVKEKVSGRVNAAAHAAVGKLSEGAEYVRQRDVRGMVSDATSVIRRNPAPVVIVAGLVGFFVGRAVTINSSRRRRSIQNAKAALIAAAASNFKEVAGVLFPKFQEMTQRAAAKARSV